MDIKEQIAAFADDLEKLVDRYRDEFDLPYVAFVGVLEIAKHELLAEMSGIETDDGDED